MGANGLLQASKRNLSTVLYPKFHDSFFFTGSIFWVALFPRDIPSYIPHNAFTQQPQPHPVIYPPVKRRANRRGLRVSAFLPRANNGHADAGHR